MSGHRVTGLNHVNVTFPDGRLDEALTFYRDLLGLAEQDRPAGASTSGAWLWIDRSAGVELHLSGEAPDGDWPVGSGRHVGLLVADLQATRGRLATAGVAIESARPLPNRDRFFVRDPFGNRVELLAWTDAGSDLG